MTRLQVPADPGRRERTGSTRGGERTPAHRVLALQRSAGNSAVGHLIGRRELQRQAVAPPRAITRAVIRRNRARFDANSVRVIQMTVGAGVDGVFGQQTGRLVADFQTANGLPDTGEVDEPTLDAMVAANVAAGMEDETLYLVADFFDLDTRSDTLTVHFDPALAVDSQMTRESGNLRVISVGPSALSTAQTIRIAIESQLNLAPPPAAPLAARPTHLTPAAERAAIRFNRLRFRDRRSAIAIQGLVGADPDGVFGEDTVERIAELQSTAGLQVDGKVGRSTLEEIVARLDDRGDRNAAIRLIVDFQRLDERGLLDVSFDAGVAANASTGSAQIPGPTTVRVGPSGFGQSFAGLVHTIAHEFEHVRQRRIGIQNRNEREFLGERIEILSRGMVEEDFAGFVDDAARALAHFNALPAADRRRLWARFHEVRQKVRQRFRAATPAERAADQALLDSYNLVVRP